jgi:hypothetical protein
MSLQRGQARLSANWSGSAKQSPLMTRSVSNWQCRCRKEIAGGRPLKHPMEHFGEAAVISLASRAQKMKALMLCDDYGARVAAKNRNVEPVSVHKLMHLMIRQGKLTATEAATFADALHTAGRHPDYTAQELASGRLIVSGSHDLMPDALRLDRHPDADEVRLLRGPAGVPRPGARPAP